MLTSLSSLRFGLLCLLLFYAIGCITFWGGDSEYLRHMNLCFVIVYCTMTLVSSLIERR